MFALCMMALSLFEGGVAGICRKDMSDWFVIDDLANCVRNDMMEDQISAGKKFQTVLRVHMRHNMPLCLHTSSDPFVVTPPTQPKAEICKQPCTSRSEP
jgi:hypothetical protein